MPKITKDFIPVSQKKQRPGFRMNPKYITVHNTANSNKGADAEMHSRYLHNGAGGRTVGWHFTVDDKEIYQHLPTNENGWHAGDGNGNGNMKSIGIEICENSDGDFDKAVKNAQWLIKKLMKKHNISISNVVPHKHWTGKNCPRLLLGMWETFKDGIRNSKSTSIRESTKPSSKKYHSIVDYLKARGIDSSFNNRKRLAAKYGIKNYRGTASQNVALLNKLQRGSTVSSKPKSFKPGQRVTLKRSAVKYATGQHIPPRYLGKTYTIQQAKSDRVLLKELYSWVYKNDVQ
ncbi:N-acetylmuramoyl-L-alanine amidase [Virgibacillus proomii]|uniref:N-acetylmuramoyl-L-alanine amidase n=1 Tax=Virgibacillus proomii TaxID=84407 RepID=UPI0009866A64|nr:N-acetylmuramoyl-L-alanine amidase [Virgibacillus proomii]